ncbi:sialidase family protein [Streptomyces sp. DSM 44917]|uniref:exo-alpha-sialidase n=1 Tax=Streptomyces boetiae TaxID=3075541 RepID=A0ABU2L5V2_9ACTN|nr:sialidase family protein [Streptomyces sp. DSM 44917]MDT0306933.1 sialidase family protein [Streptomyces sp. DSM 44917]
MPHAPALFAALAAAALWTLATAPPAAPTPPSPTPSSAVSPSPAVPSAATSPATPAPEPTEPGEPPASGGPSSRAEAPRRASAGGPAPELSAPFVHHTEGYACFRIPALVATPGGTLLAFAEGRVVDCDDVGDIDLLLKRSTDGGRTWGPLTVLRGDGDEDGFGNPTPVVDEETGRVSVLHAHNAWTLEGEDRVRGPRSLHVLHSADEGVTWERGADLSALKGEDWTWVSVGPGHGLQLRNGPHAGRLIVPGDHDAASGRSGAQLYYSDDGGLTWHTGALYETASEDAHPGELTVAERADGTLYVNARSSATCGTQHHRLAATSEDGGASFAGEGFAPVTDVQAPPVSGSVLVPREGRMLLSAPARPGAEAIPDRWMMAVRTSEDEGATWSTTGTVITPDRSGYSDLALLPDGEIGLLYETDSFSPHGTLTFTAFTEETLDAGAGDVILPRAPDASGQENHAVVHGGAQPSASGRWGGAMTLDGTDDYLRLINCPPSLRLDGEEFAVSAWFRYEAGDGGHPLLWGYGHAPGRRQFWLRAEPAEGRLRGALDVGDAETAVTVDTGAAFNDGTWHHVLLEREGGQLRLSVDGATPAVTAAPPGPVTPDDPFSLHLGARPDYAEHFAGALDDVRIYGRALSDAEAAEVRAGADGPAKEELRVRLAFDEELLRGLPSSW